MSPSQDEMAPYAVLEKPNIVRLDPAGGVQRADDALMANIGTPLLLEGHRTFAGIAGQFGQTVGEGGQDHG